MQLVNTLPLRVRPDTRRVDAPRLDARAGGDRAASAATHGLHCVAALRERLTDWLVQQALPMWSTTGVDHHLGGYFERIDLRGRPVQAPRRARVVARQVYVFATAARRGWLPRADALVEHGLAFLRERLRRSDGRTVHAAVHVDGRVARGGFDLYEHAFVLFALAEACRGRPDRDGLRTEALALLEGLRDEWSHPVAGFVDDAMRAGVMLANPHMHLLEAALAWSQISTGPSQRAWDHLADELVQLCLARCIDAGDGALSERFDADWRAAQGPLARLIEPGHQFEWAWLLLRWARMRRTRDAVDAAEQLLRVGEGCGVDAERGVAVNALGGDLGIADPRAKLWPQTERIKAWSEAHAQGLSWAGGGAQAPLARAVRGLSKFFLDQPRGLWREEMHADGSFAPEPCKASSLYHIVCAVDALHDLHDGALPSPIGGAP